MNVVKYSIFCVKFSLFKIQKYDINVTRCNITLTIGLPKSKFFFLFLFLINL